MVSNPARELGFGHPARREPQEGEEFLLLGRREVAAVQAEKGNEGMVPALLGELAQHVAVFTHHGHYNPCYTASPPCGTRYARRIDVVVWPPQRLG